MKHMLKSPGQAGATLRIALLAALCLSVPTVAQESADVTALNERLVGTWITQAVPFAMPGGEVFVRRTATFLPDHERLVVEAFADPDMTQPLLTYDSEGPMTTAGPWDVIQRASAIGRG